jgi:hypothetical protein
MAGSAPISGWTVSWTTGGPSMSQIWNGTLRNSGSSVSVSNVSYNGSLPASGSTSFGFIGTGSPSSTAPACQTS